MLLNMVTARGLCGKSHSKHTVFRALEHLLRKSSLALGWLLNVTLLFYKSNLLPLLPLHFYNLYGL